jgi:hypothetical protein
LLTSSTSGGNNKTVTPVKIKVNILIMYC